MGNYSDKTYSLAGETGIYKLVASKKIKPNDEILWYYGSGYERNYNVSKN